MITKEECQSLKKKLESLGWTCDVDDEKRIGFTLYEDEAHEWIRDYNKETGMCYYMNGKQRVNIQPMDEASNDHNNRKS